jgi:uncharacterized repeat protein (TIGR03803 family)
MAHKRKYFSLIRFSTLLIAGALSVAPMAASGPTFQTLVILNGVDNGGQPWSAPISDQAGNLYGTTSEGGNGPCSVGEWTLGCGTVYKLSPPVDGAPWTQTLLYQFQGSADGTYPVGGLLLDATGNLYGTTENGGADSCGTAFKLTPPTSGSGPWSKDILYSFACGSHGAYPESSLIFDKSGNLYGTAVSGGSCNDNLGCGGVVYELTPPSTGGGAWTESVLYAFPGGREGYVPQSTLVLSGGKLYGTTIFGGTGNTCEEYENCGTIFELSPPASPGGAWTESVLHSFAVQETDGNMPRSGLIRDRSGNFYGVTEFGGNYGVGTVYQFTPPASAGRPWTESVLYSFDYTEGADPFGNLAISASGSLYGTTQFGGPSDNGNVFQLSPPAVAGDPWVATSLVIFNPPGYPLAGLTFGANGWLYGATLGAEETDECATSSSGQNLGCGILFRILP